jgi:hypothetical protein
MRCRLIQSLTHAAVGTVASCALVGAIAPQASQAAVFTYGSTFSLTANSGTLPVLLPEIATGSAQFTKADSVTFPGLFDYQVTDFQATLVPLSLSFTLDSLRQPQNAVLLNTLNTAVFAQVPAEFQNYRQILPSVLAGTSPNYTGDGDFPPLGTFSYTFSSQDVQNGVTLASTQLPALNLPPAETARISGLLGLLPSLFPNGGTASITLTQIGSTVAPVPPGEVSVPVPEASVPVPDSVVPDVSSSDSNSTAAPEPATIAGMALAGGALMAARRRKKQKVA